MAEQKAQRENVQVCIRTRPTSDFAQDNIKIDNDNAAMNIFMPKPTGQTVNNQQERWSFKFDHVLHNASQQAVHERVAGDIVNSVMHGYNGTLMAYGQTGAGKTFTMLGGTSNYKHRGIVPRSIADIFRFITNKPEVAFTVRVSYLEIYNEQFFDLLDPNCAKLADLAIADDDHGNVHVKGLKKLVVENEEAALNMLFEGETNRSIAEHEMNQSSTRSHCIFTLYVESRSRVESSEKVIFSKLNLVDLAGSERVGKTGSVGKILEEARYINRSLSFLEQVVLALASKSREHVPFRQSKLTNFLRDSLGGNCKTRLIANVWAEKEQMEETISTLKFATRMMKVSTEAAVNVQMDPLMQVSKLQKQVRDLKQELAMHDTLANRSGVNYDNYTPEQQADLQAVVLQYLTGVVDEIEVVSLRQVKETFKIMKMHCQSVQLQLKDGGSVAFSNLANGEVGLNEDDKRMSRAISRSSNVGAPAMVGDLLEGNNGFSLGVAGANARPINAADAMALKQNTPRIGSSVVHPAATTSLAKSAKLSAGAVSSVAEDAPVKFTAYGGGGSKPTEDEAFREFKATQGKDMEQTYQHNKNELRLKKSELNRLGGMVNGVKKEIDQLTSRIHVKRTDRESQVNLSSDNSDVQVIDEEEYDLIRQTKSKKKTYSELFAARRAVSDEVVYLKGIVEQSQMALAQSFLQYFQNQTPVGGSRIDGAPHVKAADDDQLDYGEQFEMSEREKIIEDDPDSIHFYNAKKTAAGGKKTTSPRKHNSHRKR